MKTESLFDALRFHLAEEALDHQRELDVALPLVADGMTHFIDVSRYARVELEWDDPMQRRDRRKVVLETASSLAQREVVRFELQNRQAGPGWWLRLQPVLEMPRYVGNRCRHDGDVQFRDHTCLRDRIFQRR